MAFERFTKDARATVLAALEEARSSGQSAAEAEHLLLALAAHPDLHRFRLDRDKLVAALAQEEERSLAAVGIATADFDLSAAHRTDSTPKLATSAKLALQRGLTIAVKQGGRRIQAIHVLGGVLATEHGRVPRALQIAGINIDELRAQI
jgi:ATP-dependent Clp protease ATP-binding subunit ClpA